MFKKEAIMLLIILVSFVSALSSSESHEAILEKVDSYRNYNSEGYSFLFNQ